MDRAFSTYVIARSRSPSPSPAPQERQDYSDHDLQCQLQDILANSSKARVFFADINRANTFAMLLYDNGIDPMDPRQEEEVVGYYQRHEIYLSSSDVLYFNGRDKEGKSLLDRAIAERNVLTIQCLFSEGVLHRHRRA